MPTRPPASPRPQPVPRPGSVLNLEPADVRAAVAIVAGKWVPHVLVALAGRPLRHGRLRKAVGEPVNDKVFTQTLRRMESDGLVERVVLNGASPAVLYRLTPDGRAILECVAPLTDWYRRRNPAGGAAGGG